MDRLKSGKKSFSVRRESFRAQARRPLKGNFYRLCIGNDVVQIPIEKRIVMTYAQAISNRIKALCKERNLSINKLSILAGINRQRIHDIIRCTYRNPSIQSIYLIAQGFNMTISEFLNIYEFNTFEIDDDDD
jgi:DNA-binding XRE family transcriptional regulator